MMKSARGYARRVLATGGSLLFFSSVVPAVAQTPAGGDQPAAGGEQHLEEIVVTATRRTELLKNVPMAVDVVSANELSKKQIFDFKDIDQLAPGLVLQNLDGRSNTATLRGIAFNPDSGTLPTVDVYFNDVQADAQTLFTSIYDIDQIEVLRGPQGLLRGSTSPAGAITLKTKEPSLTTYNGYVQATGSDQDAYNFQGAVSVPVVEDELGVRVAAMGDQNPINNVRNVTRGDSSIGNTASGRLSVNFAPTDDFKGLFTYQYLYANNVQYAQVIGIGNAMYGAYSTIFPKKAPLVSNGPAISLDDRAAVAPGVDDFRNRTHFLTLSADYDIGDDTLALNAGYQDSLLSQAHSLNIGNVAAGYLYQQDVHTPYSTTSAEIRYLSKGREFWNYMIGVDFIRQLNPVSVQQPSDQFITSYQFSPGKYLNFLPQYTQVPVDVNIFIPDQYTHYSVFGSSSFDFTDQLKLDLGLRYQVFRVHQQSNLTVFAQGKEVANNIPTIRPPGDIRTDHAFTGGVDLTYKITPDQVAYVSYGHSFRPGVSAVGVTAQLANDIILTKGETSDAFELGLKGSWFDHRLNFNGDVFYQHFNGYVGRTVQNINYSSLSNGNIDGSLAMNFNADVINTGIEGQLSAVITRGWEASMNASWVNGQYDNALIPCNLYKNGNAYLPVGEQIAYCPSNGRNAETPKFHLTVQSEYDFDIGSAYEPFVSGLLTYQPGWHSSIINYDYDDLPILNVYAGVRSDDQGWDFTVFAKNLFDTQRIRSISATTYQQAAASVLGYKNNALGPGAPLDSGYYSVITTLPREVGVTLRYHF